MIAISSLVAADCEALVPDLVRLTVDAVDGGALLGWHAPLDPDDAARYWEGRITRFDGERTALFAAFSGDDLVGAVQRERALLPACAHRAGISMLMVLRPWRRRGIARALLDELEDDAFVRGMETLLLEAPAGEAIDALVRELGFERTGSVAGALKLADGTLRDTICYAKLLR